MKVRVVMDSGKEYVINANDDVLQNFTSSFYSDIPNESQTLKNSLVNLDEDDTLMINPTHISSIEVLER